MWRSSSTSHNSSYWSSAVDDLYDLNDLYDLYDLDHVDHLDNIGDLDDLHDLYDLYIICMFSWVDSVLFTWRSCTTSHDGSYRRSADLFDLYDLQGASPAV